ncbi:MAG: alpha/beta hydrolase family protein [Acidimicrobiales bacterium]
MPFDRLEAMFRRFTWRITSNYVSPWELEELKGEIGRYEEWCSAWSARAADHARRGDEARAAGRRRSAGDAYVRAALFYHWASFLFAADLDQLHDALVSLAACWRQAASLVSPPMELIEVPFEGATLHGYLRIPPEPARPPLVLLLPGADSTKEELYNLGEHLLERGVAFAAFDGPGQGLVSFDLKLRHDFEVPVGVMLDHLSDRKDVDTHRIAVGGISYGGMFACRAAAFDERVRAVLSMSSWYSSAGRFSGMDPLSQVGLRHYMGPDPAALQDQMTLAGVAERIRVPVLQIYGGQDPASPPEEAYRVAAEARGPVETVVFEEGVHVCNNIWYKARPLAADWLAERLARPEEASP